MEDWVAIVISVVAAGMAGVALWLSLKQDRRANEHHDVEWQSSWSMWTLWLTNEGTDTAHDVQVVVDGVGDTRVVERHRAIPGGASRPVTHRGFSTRNDIHRAAGGSKYTEEIRIRATWRTKLGGPRSQTLDMTLT